MSTAFQLDLLDLRHYSSRQMRPLLEDEARKWAERLDWDYKGSIELLLQYLDSRILPGVVALDRGRICGYSFCVYEGDKAVIGDTYAIDSPNESAQEIERQLLIHMLETLQNTPHVHRVESQLLLHESGAITEPFVSAGFRIYPRLFLHCDLRGKTTSEIEPSDPVDLPDGLRLTTWLPGDFQAAGDLIHRTYLEHEDSVINDQYRSLHGSLRFLHNIVRFPGCGTFDPDASFVLAGSALEGMVLCSRVAPKVAHITQLCVSPSLRGRGYGRMLLQTCADALRKHGVEAITLTVTESNQKATALYERMGFVTKHRFDAMVWDKR